MSSMVFPKRLIISLLLLFCTLFSQAHMIHHWQHSVVGKQSASVAASVQHISVDGQRESAGSEYPQRIDSPCSEGFAGHQHSGAACHCLLSLYNVQHVNAHSIVLNTRQYSFPSEEESLSQYDPHGLNPPPRSFC